MLAIAYVTSFLGMIVLPIVLGIYLVRRFKLSWKLLLAGGLTFIASQVLHIPFLVGLTALFNNGILPAPPAAWATLFNAVLLGLLAGIFEETARYVLFKFVLKQARTWNEGVLVGVCLGGVEAILIGVCAAAAFGIMLASKNAGAPTIPGIQPEQVAAYWSAPIYMAFLGLIERVFAVCLHVSLSAMVLYSLASKQLIWFWLALLWHALVDALAVYLVPVIGVVALEGVVAVLGILSLGFLFYLRTRFSLISEGAQLEPTAKAAT